MKPKQKRFLGAPRHLARTGRCLFFILNGTKRKIKSLTTNPKQKTYQDGSTWCIIMNETVAYVMFGGLKTTPESIIHVQCKFENVYKFMWVFCIVWGIFSLHDFSSRIRLGHQFSFLIEIYWFSSVGAHKHTPSEFAVGQACCTLCFIQQWKTIKIMFQFTAEVRGISRQQ